MAFNSANLALISSVNGFGYYRYDTTETAAAVATSGFFNNADDSQNFAVGDVIDIVVWGSAVRTGTISSHDRVIVNSVSAAGVVDTTNPIFGPTVADTY